MCHNLSSERNAERRTHHTRHSIWTVTASFRGLTSCSPKDLPEFIEVDLADMELDQVIHLSDIKAPKGVTFIALAHDSDLPVVSIHKAKGASADSESAAGAAEGESEGGE